MFELRQIVSDFASALKHLDASAPQGKSKSRAYQPGVGPLTESEAISRSLPFLKQISPEYISARPICYPSSRKTCDLVVPGQWALEFKLVRPFGDNGKEAEQWSENLLHPYPGNTSSLGDCYKLRDSHFVERKAIVVFGYEHTPPLVEIEVVVKCFEVIATQTLGFRLGERHSALVTGLIHPVHQQCRVYGWEILLGTP